MNAVSNRSDRNSRDLSKNLFKAERGRVPFPKLAFDEENSSFHIYSLTRVLAKLGYYALAGSFRNQVV